MYGDDLDDNRSWSEKYRIAGEDWADKEAAAQLLEDTKSATLAQWQAELGDMAVSRSELAVKSSTKWKKYIQDLVEARKNANIAKINLEVVRMKAFEQQAQEANQRTELRILGR